MTANLSDHDTCWCPACGALIEDATLGEDPDGTMDDGTPEYWLHCPECGQSFYASKSY